MDMLISSVVVIISLCVGKASLVAQRVRNLPAVHET